ncbi:MAG: diacylglycerol kinase family protein [Flavobacteriia bacterium]|nr:MAG: diacylglycerol kinase family protein [Flavobacteriia bacterium]
MKDPNDNYFKTRIKSLKYALRGAYLLIKTEPSIQVQFSIAILMTLIGFFFHLSATEWMLQLLAIGLILVAESINTGIEKLSDFVHPNYHKDIGFIKDISAGASAFAAIIAIIIGLIIYLPKIF